MDGLMISDPCEAWLGHKMAESYNRKKSILYQLVF